MGVDAVVFDWGGTLSLWADVDLADVWSLAARHIDPERSEELTLALIAVERRFWQRVEATQHSADLTQVLQTASEESGLDVTEAVLEEAATHHLDAWTQHIRHDPDAAAVTPVPTRPAPTATLRDPAPLTPKADLPPLSETTS